MKWARLIFQIAVFRSQVHQKWTQIHNINNKLGASVTFLALHINRGEINRGSQTLPLIISTTWQGLHSLLILPTTNIFTSLQIIIYSNI